MTPWSSGSCTQACADGVHAHHLAGQRVVDQVAPLLFAVRQDLQQHQAAHGGELELGVVQRLVLSCTGSL
jgi:hypothetical protein